MYNTQLLYQSGFVLYLFMFAFQIDSYSGFYDNGGFHQTELNQILKDKGITRLIVTGLALDFCVYYTSKDGKMLGRLSF